ncbi:MAG: hypothetical protein ACXVCI_15420 [Bdellovibrionota bacterium]
MFWASSKTLYLVALVALGATSARAETGVVSATGAGHDTPEAITNLLRTTIGKYFKNEPDPQLTRTILQTEILPNASSFVQSYRITDGSKSGLVSLSANIDLDVIHGLLSLTPKNIGEADGAKALVLVHGAKLPDSVVSSLKNPGAVADPFSTLAEAGRERLFRREFTEAQLTNEDMQAVGVGEDFSSPEVLRGLGAKAGARIVLGITGRYETFDNENSHNKEERVVLAATMVDVSAGTVIARTSVNVVNPKTRKEQYVADLQRNILEESKDLFQDVFVAAGRRLVKGESHTEFSVVRILYPSNATLVTQFKALLEAVPGVRSVVEYSIARGKYDFAVRPPLADTALAKAITAMQSPDITVAALESLATEPEAHPPSISVKIAPKETAPPAEEGGANAIPSTNAGPNPRR